MDLKHFTLHMRAGTGRPFIYAQTNDLSPFRDVILDACLHCYSVDPQSEGTRAGYMLELVNLLPEAEFFKNQVLLSLSEAADNWDTVQRFHFATYMAMDGHPQGRQAIYDHFNPGPELGDQIAIDFFRLDGLKGLVFAAAQLGQQLQTNPGKLDLRFFWNTAIETCGEQESLAILAEEAQKDPRIQTFLIALNTKHTQANPRTPSSYEALLPELPHLSSFQLWRWAKNASPADLDAATFALNKITHPAVRDLALLAQNFQQGDHKLALSSFENEPDRDIRHSMQINLRNFWKRHPDPDSEPGMLHTLYNLGPCSTCREFVVHRLLQLNALTPEMRQECAYDANEEIRSAIHALQET